MRRRVFVSVKMVNGERWGDLSAIAPTHDICGERVDCIDSKFTFAGQHRVRLYRFRKNVHWRLPQEAIELDISAVPVAQVPRRTQRG